MSCAPYPAKIRLLGRWWHWAKDNFGLVPRIGDNTNVCIPLAEDLSFDGVRLPQLFHPGRDAQGIGVLAPGPTG